MESLVSRRQLVGGGIAGSIAASALGSVAVASAQAVAPPSPAEVLTQALRIEQLLVIAYRQTLSSGALGNASDQIRRQLAHALEHVATLERALRALGGVVPAAPAGAAQAQAALERHQVSDNLERLPTRHACLRLLIDIETLAEAAYFAALSTLDDPRLLRVCVEMMGCVAQHWTVLSDLQHHGDVTQAVPYAFVRGSAGI